MSRNGWKSMNQISNGEIFDTDNGDIWQLFETNTSNQKYLQLRDHFQLDDSYAFPEAILYECQRLCKFDYLYSSFVYGASNDKVYCIGCPIG